MDSKTLYKVGRKMKDKLQPLHEWLPVRDYMMLNTLHHVADAIMDVAKDQEAAQMKKARIEEYFVEIDGYPNYQVSSYGRIVNVKFDRDLQSNKKRADGYCYVSLSNDGLKEKFMVHHIVAKAFFVNYREGYEVKHINGNTEDNSVANLHLSPKRNRLRED